LKRVHPRNKLDVGYRLSRSGLAVAYGYKNISYQGPIIAGISIASDSSKVNITYSAEVSPSIELRNPDGFEVKSIDFSFPLISRLYLFAGMLRR
jgi:sialate O-acetylesterase